MIKWVKIFELFFCVIFGTLFVISASQGQKTTPIEFSIIALWALALNCANDLDNLNNKK